MIDIIPQDITSLKVLQPELAASLQKATRHFEAFVADRSAVEQLADSEKCTGDIAGILKLLQMPGALQLTEEMSRLLKTV